MNRIIEVGDLQLVRDIPKELALIPELQKKNKLLSFGLITMALIGTYLVYKLYKKNIEDET
jgi:hypothetical protein